MPEGLGRGRYKAGVWGQTRRSTQSIRVTLSQLPSRACRGVGVSEPSKGLGLSKIIRNPEQEQELPPSNPTRCLQRLKAHASHYTFIANRVLQQFVTTRCRDRMPMSSSVHAHAWSCTHTREDFGVIFLYNPEFNNFSS